MITWYVMTVANNGLSFPSSEKIGQALMLSYKNMIENEKGFSYRSAKGTVSISPGVVSRSIFLFTEVSE